MALEDEEVMVQGYEPPYSANGAQELKRLQYNPIKQSVVVLLGHGGLRNYRTQHRGNKKCQVQEKKRKLTETQPKPRKDGSISSFFAPKAQATAAKVASLFRKSPPPARSATLSSESSAAAAEPLLARLRHLVNQLPATIPEGTDDNVLAAFAGDPSKKDAPDIPSIEIWEHWLNKFMKEHLGWAGDVDSSAIIRRGEKGVTGLLRFVEYFVIKREVDASLFEGKLTLLMDAMEKLGSGSTNLVLAERHETETSAPCNDWIDVDDLEDNAVEAQTTPPTRKTPCPGYLLKIPNGRETYDVYPLRLHKRLNLAWIIREISMVKEGEICFHCGQLPENQNLKNIIQRMEEGTHEKMNYDYYGFAGLVELLESKNRRIDQQRLHGLNQARKLLSKAHEVSNYKRFVFAVRSGDVKRVARVVDVALKRRMGIKSILNQLSEAAKGAYNVKSFTDEERLAATLLWRLGGDRVGSIVHRIFGLPSVSNLRNTSTRIPLIVSPGKPTVAEVEHNTESALQTILPLLESDDTIRHMVLMFDELAVEKCLRWDGKTNKFLGVCREHGEKGPLEFVNANDLEVLVELVDNGTVDHAKDATTGAIGILCRNNKIYPARPVLLSGDCKKESGQEHAKLLSTTLEGVNNTIAKLEAKLRTIALTSDGETRRGSAMIILTFKAKLSPRSPIHIHLSSLAFLDLMVGDDDLTCDKDWKHVLKQLRNLLLRISGIVVNAERITPDIVKHHLKSSGQSKEHINSIYNPDDKQDVKLAFDLLQDVWSFPEEVPPDHAHKPGYSRSHRTIWMLGRLLFYLVAPYLAVELSLSQQLEYLSAAAHIAFALFRHDGKDFMPSLLYVDIMIMIKNVYFCIAKAKVDTPKGEFFIILLGTDRLEIQFGVLRTIIGTDANLDMLQLGERFGSVIEATDILAERPEWDKAPRRLQLSPIELPSSSTESKKRPKAKSSDHLSPKHWVGDVHIETVSLSSCWRAGRLIAEAILTQDLATDLRAAEENPNVTILAPHGTLILNTDIQDIDDTLDDLETRPAAASDEAAAALHVDVENELDDQLAEADNTSRPFERMITVNGKVISKSRALSMYTRYRKKVSSTDRLKRVQDVERYQVKLEQASIGNSSNGDASLLVIHDPIATLAYCEDKLWLCFGEVKSIKFDGNTLDQIPESLLTEKATTISFQLMGLRPATLDDDSTAGHDWRTCSTSRERSFDVPGRAVQAVDPEIAYGDQGPYYLLKSSLLVAISASLFELLSPADKKAIPKVVASLEFPYREQTGKACFLCTSNRGVSDINISELEDSQCTRCAANGKNVVLDLLQPQRVLEHIGAHILFDEGVNRSDEPCGLCLNPSPQCKFWLKKGTGGNLRVDLEKSNGCPNNVNYNYGNAVVSKPNAPCSNVPITCPLCPKSEPSRWRYNLKHHFLDAHPSSANSPDYMELWAEATGEREGMQKIWNERYKSLTKKSRAKKDTPKLVVSEVHTSSVFLTDRYVVPCISKSLCIVS
ncbi:hypothetical protein BKA70DRAFT_1377423 [Coprinopsis sp. MPI-PUGE-AT-0042]|nr:hypothetical protein BKA70DRAFT_1377423 [Coprinopsis sp. MPI-PUGE-AT-0042]